MTNLPKIVTERDFRKLEFLDADPADYEFDGTGDPVRKDRWKTAIHRIKDIVGIGGRDPWEITDVVNAVGAAFARPQPTDDGSRPGVFAGVTVGDDGQLYRIYLAETENEIPWSTAGSPRGDAAITDRFNGALNTKNLLCTCRGEFDLPAVRWASECREGGKDDWYLPSVVELTVAALYAPQMFKAHRGYWSSTQSTKGNGALVFGNHADGPQTFTTYMSSPHIALAMRRVPASC